MARKWQFGTQLTMIVFIKWHEHVRVDIDRLFDKATLIKRRIGGGRWARVIDVDKLQERSLELLIRFRLATIQSCLLRHE